MNATAPAENDICRVKNHEDRCPLWQPLARDALLLTLLLSALALLLNDYPERILAALAAFAVAFFACGLFHEWGHYLGAKLSGAHAPRNRAGRIFPLFNFNMAQNTDGQFLAMSYGGNIAQWVFAFLGIAIVGSATLVAKAIVCGVVAVSLLGSLTEVPIIARVYRFKDANAAWQDYLAVRKQELRRATIAGVVLTIALFFVLAS